MSRVWTVEGYERTTRMMRVEADSEEEAIEKALAGEYSGPTLTRPAWTASEGWAHGGRGDRR